MSTATVEPKLVSQPDQGIVYLSRREDLRLVKTPKRPVYAHGERVDVTPGQTLRFEHNRLYVPFEGEVTLENGEKIDAAEARAFLDKHRLNGDVEGGFWAAVTPAPAVSGDELQTIVDAALTFDEAKLEAIIEQERSGWNRDAVVGAASDALAKMRAALAAQQEWAEAAAAEQAKAKKPAARKQD